MMAIKKLDRTVINDPNAQKIRDPMFGGVYIGAFDMVTIGWDAEDAATGYNIYFSMFPLLRYKVNEDPITTTEYTFRLPIFPQNLYFYFWVEKITDAGSSFINEEGATFYTVEQTNFYEQTESPITNSYVFPETENINAAMKELILKRIPADTKFILESNGADCDVYMRRWGTDQPYGIPCVCTDDTDADSDFGGRGRCDLCFGTGVLGGFYPPIKMIIRFNTTPPKEFKGMISGLKVTQAYDGWSIPDPILRAGDMIVRRLDGERYVVTEVKIASQRNIATRQDLAFHLISINDIRRLVSLNTINEALAKTSDPRFNKMGRSNF